MIKMKGKKALMIALALALVLASGCAKDISRVKSQEYVGEDVTIKGSVEKTLKLGPVSGFTLKDETGMIAVKSEALPAEGSKVKVKGTLMKDTLLGYYIHAKRIS